MCLTIQRSIKKTFNVILELIMNYKQSDIYKEKHLMFWSLEKVKRPLIGFTVGLGQDSWSYWQDNRAAQALLSLNEISPENISPADFIEDQVKYLKLTEEIGDDIIRSAMPLASIPWMEAIIGCKIISTKDSISALKIDDEIDRIGIPPFDVNNKWIQKYFEFFNLFEETLKGSAPVGQSIIRGPSDLLCAVMGTENAAIALIDEPDKVRKLLDLISNYLELFLSLHLKRLPKFLDGYVIGQYELWAPEPPIRIQEDYSNLFSGEMYKEFLQKLDNKIAGISKYTLIHLHSSSLHLIDQFLEVDTIRVFQITKDPNVVSLDIMMNALKKIQESRKPLVVKGRFSGEDISLMKSELSASGLCVQPVVKNFQEIDELMPHLTVW